MGNIEQNLEAADEHVNEAQSRLRRVTSEVKEIIRQEAKPQVEVSDDLTFDVEISHRETVRRLNRELPDEFYARLDDGDITIEKFDPDDFASDEGGANIKQLIAYVESHDPESGANEEKVISLAEKIGLDPENAEEKIMDLKMKGEAYEPSMGYLRTA